MRVRSAVLMAVLAVTVSGGWAYATTRDMAEAPEVALQQLAPDTMVMSWNSVQTTEQQIARYEYEIKKVAGDTLLVSGQTVQLMTIFAVPSPALGDSITIYGRVRGVNTRGIVGAWGRSPNFKKKPADPGPAAPNPIIRDTTESFTLSEVMIGFRAVGGAHPIVSDAYSLSEGDSVEVCALGTDGLQVRPEVAAVWSSDNPAVAALGTAAGPGGAHCRWLYAVKDIGNLLDLGLTRFAPFSRATLQP